jgi:hypothetical protein
MSQFASSKRSFWPKRLPAAESWSMLFYFLIEWTMGEAIHDQVLAGKL